MWKSILLAALATFLLGAEPATKPDAFDGKVYAMSLAGIYPHEDALVREARDDASDESDRNAATQAAICNEWNGPFRLRDFALWLQQTHLDKRVSLDTANWDSDPSFKHLPSSMQKLSFRLLGAIPMTVVVIAVDKALTFEEVESVLKNPSKTPAGEGPIVYCVEPDEVFPGTIIAPEKE